MKCSKSQTKCTLTNTLSNVFGDCARMQQNAIGKFRNPLSKKGSTETNSNNSKLCFCLSKALEVLQNYYFSKIFPFVQLCFIRYIKSFSTKISNIYLFGIVLKAKFYIKNKTKQNNF